MYRKSKQIIPNENKNVKTSMIWGSLWDQTLNWLVISGNKEYSDFEDSTSWGNYKNSTVSGHGSKKPTGYSDVWKANNIYDMAGNVEEWNLEAGAINYRVNRGGVYDGLGRAFTPGNRMDYYYPSKSTKYTRHPCHTLHQITSPQDFSKQS